MSRNKNPHAVAIARPTAPGDPYIITCPCGFVAEAHYPTAALVGAYDHKGTLYEGSGR
jgi:hypothetical protein